MGEQLQFGFFASLDFPGRTTLRVEEIAEKLGVTTQHILDLIDEKRLTAMDVRGEGATRATYRVPVEAYRNYVAATLTEPAESLRLLRHLPRATLRELVRELNEFLKANP